MQMHTPDDLLTTKQVADAKAVNVTTVNRWAKSGRLPVAVKLSGIRGANLFRRADVDALVDTEPVAS